jgi:hypothetical protein
MGARDPAEKSDFAERASRTKPTFRDSLSEHGTVTVYNVKTSGYFIHQYQTPQTHLFLDLSIGRIRTRMTSSTSGSTPTSFVVEDLVRNSTDPSVPWVVQKYGGTSVGKSLDSITKIVEQVCIPLRYIRLLPFHGRSS